MLSQDVRSSVSLSVTRRYSVEAVKRIIKLFTVGWPHHCSFSAPNGMAIFRWGPPNGGRQVQGV